MTSTELTTCLWFSGNGEEAARYYTGIFRDSSIDEITHFTSAGPGPEGAVASVAFTLNGQKFLALSGAPGFTFTQSFSIRVPCVDQAELDYYWDALTAGGEASRGGWLKDKYGMSWQVFPAVLPEMLASSDGEKAARAAKAMMGTVGKFSFDALQQAFDGS
jgi:predicted 3-demethylubiquinone-9 3-methyltransferase (glyoxalase superfamily)